MTELRVHLEKEMDNSKANMAHLERGKTPVENYKPPKKQEIGGSMAQIKSCWENLAVQIKQRKEKASHIISKLQHIEELLTKLPASNMAKIQPYQDRVMDSGHGRMRMNMEGDRLSSLPDDLIHKVLSSFDIRNVIEISVLSHRWRFIWTSMPYLNFSSKNFSTLPKFSKFVTHEIQAQNLMAELRVLLDKEKDNSKTNRAHLERGKTPVEGHEPEKLEIGGRMAQIKSCWKNLVVQIKQSKEEACLIISKLHHIEELLTKLPASNRAKIKPCFSSLCAEADIAISKITDCMKIHCDENQSRSSVCFHELAATLEPSS
ncbi:hypothetical protein L1987_72333 [Smallanthus sonchifolius]|uniref:Uncharacterized protein n=1 Tax=Smallanthus sonchifolius TaxID=185202 RepID=A0ACB9AUC1_9ASTR|nr:hypothetical protein L1987_72333 [Smallanthus sonchifolius]